MGGGETGVLPGFGSNRFKLSLKTQAKRKAVAIIFWFTRMNGLMAWFVMQGT